MGKIRAIILATLSLAAAVGCNSSGCIDNQNSIPLAGFYDYATLSSITVSQLSVGGVGAPNDSLLLNNGSASSIYLPFRSTASTASFFFRYETTDSTAVAVADTITFAYTSVPFFASEECGAMYKYIITHLTHTTLAIDSVAIEDSVIINTDVECIHIYFNTSSDDDDDEE